MPPKRQPFASVANNTAPHPKHQDPSPVYDSNYDWLNKPPTPPFSEQETPLTSNCAQGATVKTKPSQKNAFKSSSQHSTTSSHTSSSHSYKSQESQLQRKLALKKQKAQEEKDAMTQAKLQRRKEFWSRTCGKIQEESPTPPAKNMPDNAPEDLDNDAMEICSTSSSPDRSYDDSSVDDSRDMHQEAPDACSETTSVVAAKAVLLFQPSPATTVAEMPRKRMRDNSLQDESDRCVNDNNNSERATNRKRPAQEPPMTSVVQGQKGAKRALPLSILEYGTSLPDAVKRAKNESRKTSSLQVDLDTASVSSVSQHLKPKSLPEFALATNPKDLSTSMEPTQSKKTSTGRQTTNIEPTRALFDSPMPGDMALQLTTYKASRTDTTTASTDAKTNIASTDLVTANVSQNPFPSKTLTEKLTKHHRAEDRSHASRDYHKVMELEVGSTRRSPEPKFVGKSLSIYNDVASPDASEITQNSFVVASFKSHRAKTTAASCATAVPLLSTQTISTSDKDGSVARRLDPVKGKSRRGNNVLVPQVNGNQVGATTTNEKSADSVSQFNIGAMCQSNDGSSAQESSRTTRKSVVHVKHPKEKELHQSSGLVLKTSAKNSELASRRRKIEQEAENSAGCSPASDASSSGNKELPVLSERKVLSVRSSSSSSAGLSANHTSAKNVKGHSVSRSRQNAFVQDINGEQVGLKKALKAHRSPASQASVGSKSQTSVGTHNRDLSSPGNAHSSRSSEIQKRELWTADEAGVNVIQFVFTLSNGKTYIHPPLPSGWEVRLTRKGDRIYYVHPDFGRSNYAPCSLSTRSRPIECVVSRPSLSNEASHYPLQREHTPAYYSYQSRSNEESVSNEESNQGSCFSRKSVQSSHAPIPHSSTNSRAEAFKSPTPTKSVTSKRKDTPFNKTFLEESPEPTTSHSRTISTIDIPARSRDKLELPTTPSTMGELDVSTPTIPFSQGKQAQDKKGNNVQFLTPHHKKKTPKPESEIRSKGSSPGERKRDVAHAHALEVYHTPPLAQIEFVLGPGAYSSPSERALLSVDDNMTAKRSGSTINAHRSGKSDSRKTPPGNFSEKKFDTPFTNNDDADAFSTRDDDDAGEDFAFNNDEEASGEEDDPITPTQSEGASLHLSGSARGRKSKQSETPMHRTGGNRSQRVSSRTAPDIHQVDSSDDSVSTIGHIGGASASRYHDGRRSGGNRLQTSSRMAPVIHPAQSWDDNDSASGRAGGWSVTCANCGASTGASSVNTDDTLHSRGSRIKRMSSRCANPPLPLDSLLRLHEFPIVHQRLFPPSFYNYRRPAKTAVKKKQAQKKKQPPKKKQPARSSNKKRRGGV
jgi:hypothetical protein